MKVYLIIAILLSGINCAVGQVEESTTKRTIPQSNVEENRTESSSEELNVNEGNPVSSKRIQSNTEINNSKEAKEVEETETGVKTSNKRKVD